MWYSPLPTDSVLTIISRVHVVVMICLRLTTTLLPLYLILRLYGNDDISAEMRASMREEFPERVFFNFLLTMYRKRNL